MKYWRGYLAAGILFAFTWALEAFAESHVALMDMIYPYMTRMAQGFLANWSSGLSFCLWQALLLVAAVIVVASLVLLVIFKWNPIRWFGWVCAVVALFNLLNTGLYGLNQYAGPLAEDIYLEELDCSWDQLKAATVYYRDQANALAGSVPRDETGNVVYAEFGKDFLSFWF